MEKSEGFPDTEKHDHQLHLGNKLHFRIATYVSPSAVAMVGALYGKMPKEKTRLEVAEWCHNIAIKMPRDHRPFYYCSPEEEVYHLKVASDEEVVFRKSKRLTPSAVMGKLWGA